LRTPPEARAIEAPEPNVIAAVVFVPVERPENDIAAAVMEVLQPSPVPVVKFRALAAVEQDGNASRVGITGA
jgi:hypothetical protein